MGAVENRVMWTRYGSRRGQNKGMAHVKKKPVRKIAIVSVWQRTISVCARRSRPTFNGAQEMLEGR